MKPCFNGAPSLPRPAAGLLVKGSSARELPARDPSPLQGGFLVEDFTASQHRLECVFRKGLVSPGELAAIAQDTLPVDHDRRCCYAHAEKIGRLPFGIQKDR